MGERQVVHPAAVMYRALGVAAGARFFFCMHFVVYFIFYFFGVLNFARFFLGFLKKTFFVFSHLKNHVKRTQLCSTVKHSYAFHNCASKKGGKHICASWKVKVQLCIQKSEKDSCGSQKGE